MRLAPLVLRHLPTTDHTGSRDNIAILWRLANVLAPAGTTVAMDVEHSPRCRSPQDGCSCASVTVTLRVIPLEGP
jgi:hypothetical protein